MITHTIESYWIWVKRRQSQSYKKRICENLKFWNKHNTWHTLWSCLIRSANMKSIRQVLLNLQSGHDSVHRRTDRWTDGKTERRTDGQTTWNQYTPFLTSLKPGVWLVIFKLISGIDLEFHVQYWRDYISLLQMACNNYSRWMVLHTRITHGLTFP